MGVREANEGVEWNAWVAGVICKHTDAHATTAVKRGQQGDNGIEGPGRAVGGSTYSGSWALPSVCLVCTRDEVNFATENDNKTVHTVRYGGYLCS